MIKIEKALSLSLWVGMSLIVVAMLTSCIGTTATTRPTPLSTFTPVSKATTFPETTDSSTPTPSILQKTPVLQPTPTSTTVAAHALKIFCDPVIPVAWKETLQNALTGESVACVDSKDDARVTIDLRPLSEADGDILGERVFAVVAPFATVRDDVSLAELQARWMGQGGGLVVANTAFEPLRIVFGQVSSSVTVPDDQLRQALQDHPGALGLMPFDALDPSLKVLTVDGVDCLDKRIQMTDYPLALAINLSGPDAREVLPFVRDAIKPATNRDVDQMTTLIMTGVTAMSRGTAEKMASKGVLYPALVISDTLRAADITHVSNEVPFIRGCKVDNSYMNLVLCSDYPYLAALEAIGVDIVGLSGNHVNDFGRDGARESLQFYAKHHIPVYGSGLNAKEACKPLIWEDHGNRFAFLAALAWWPEEAWATDTEPGACYYYDHYDEIFSTVRALSKQVDIVSVELQFQETYHPWPTRDQVKEFRALHDAGADIVTGVQSHVPQAVEPYGANDEGGPSIILYGLGNLFFDQMQSWETRTALIPRHIIYHGRLLNTQLLTTVLEDFAQPRWATLEERAGILKQIFAAAPPRGTLPIDPTPTPDASTGSDATGSSVQQEPPASQSSTSDQTVLYGAETNHPQPTPPPAGIPGRIWPAHQADAQPHFLLSRPTSSAYNQVEDGGYGFGSTAGGQYRVHHGVDIANAMGTPLLAPADGVVVYAGPDDEAHRYGPYADFYGNVVVFQLDQTWHDHVVYVLYGHLQKVSVENDQRVTAGESVGATGMTGIAIGPHVHVEVRLDDPQNYDAVYNPSLWLQPFAGYGVLAGQILTPDGRAWDEVAVQAYRLTSDGSRLFRSFKTYALDDGIHADPGWGENAVLSVVPVGDYEVVVKLQGKSYHQRLRVAPGQVGYFNFVIAP